MPLPVPTDVMRVRLRAELWNGTAPVEEAQFGFWGHRVHTTGVNTDWPNDVQRVADGIRDRYNEHITNKAYWSTAVHMQSVAVDHLNAADGKVLDQGVALFTGDDAWVGTGSASLPWETTLAVSFFNYERGSFARDKARRRGRMYLPPFSTGIVIDPNGQLRPGDTTVMLEMWTAFFNDVQGMSVGNDVVGPDDYFDLGIVSRGTPLKPLPPTFYPTRFLSIDSKIDSQRRRERQQPAVATATGPIDRA